MIKIYFKKLSHGKLDSENFARNILAELLNIDNNRLVIEKNSFGKPYLKDYPSIHYNISHTKGAIVCAIASNPIGIDIEKKKNCNMKIAKRFFTKDEHNYILNNKTKLND